MSQSMFDFELKGGDYNAQLKLGSNQFYGERPSLGSIPVFLSQGRKFECRTARDAGVLVISSQTITSTREEGGSGLLALGLCDDSDGDAMTCQEVTAGAVSSRQPRRACRPSRHLRVSLGGAVGMGRRLQLPAERDAAAGAGRGGILAGAAAQKRHRLCRPLPGGRLRRHGAGRQHRPRVPHLHAAHQREGAAAASYPVAGPG